MDKQKQKEELANASISDVLAVKAKTAMASKSHLKQWLQASGRQWLVFNGPELVDALSWPEGSKILMHMVNAYVQHRQTIDSGRREMRLEPLTHEKIEVPIYKGDCLEREELDRAIRYLVLQMLQIDPDWNLENPEL